MTDSPVPQPHSPNCDPDTEAAIHPHGLLCHPTCPTCGGTGA